MRNTQTVLDTGSKFEEDTKADLKEVQCQVMALIHAD